jgi:DtxR family Mn-dependent transcriptional regulator
VAAKIHESRENYLEAILILGQKNGYVRSVDIANFLEFSKPSVSVAVANLRAAQLIEVDPLGGIHLTDEGRALAEQVYERHTVLTRLLMRLGVDEQTAEEDACHAEHVFSEQSFEAIKHLAQQIEEKGIENL